MNAGGPRILGGAWKGRKLVAPAGWTTRPTAARVRQAAFDMLLHAPWGGRAFLNGARVLDVFAGTGAYGLEALSRGAASATFIERDAAALAALRANVASCDAAARSRVLAADALAPPAGGAHDFLVLDPPYGKNAVAATIAALQAAGWIGDGAIALVETGVEEVMEMPNSSPGLLPQLLAERAHGKARVRFFRVA